MRHRRPSEDEISREKLNIFSSATLRSFNWRDRTAASAWFQEARPWLHPGPGNLLEVDEDAKSFGTVFDSPELSLKTIQMMREEKTKAKAASMLARYAPEGPGTSASADAWKEWWDQNASYLFYSELGCDRWYVDPLARKRGVPRSR